jgi:hypothetical protein
MFHSPDRIIYVLILKIVILLCLLYPLPLHSQDQHKKITISGYIHEQESLETLPGVIITVGGQNAVTLSNVYGFYSLGVQSSDTLELFFSCLGYRQYVVKLTGKADIELQVMLIPESSVMTEVVVSGKENKVSTNPQMSSITIPVSQMKNVPGLLGEKDMLKVLQLMPGIQKGREGNSGLYVRGGGPDQNLLLLDDAVIYNAFHLFGFYSLFNGDALKSTEITKGGFPARYGGRLSSVVEMNMKDGNKEAFHGEAGIGIISSKLTVEGPIRKNRSSFLISGRRTYFDVLVSPFLPERRRVSYYFYDLNTKFNYDFSKKDKIYFSSYIGADNLLINDISNDHAWKGKLNWGNVAATTRWNHLFSNKLFSNTSLVFSRYKLNGTQNFENENFRNEGNFGSFIRDLTFKSDLEYHPDPRHYIRTGVNLIYHTYWPVVTVYEETNTSKNIQNQNTPLASTIEAVESAVYFEDTYKPFSLLTINTGLRIGYYSHSNVHYLNPEPRLSAAFHITRNFSLKTSYAYMNQYVHLLTYTKAGLPADLWVPTTKNVPPQRSQQAAVGLAKDIPERKLYFTLEGYYKTSHHVIAYKNGSGFLSIENDISANWENKVTSGKGWAYGVEFLLHKKEGRFSGWIAYTLSWTQVQFDSINLGKKYYSTYDRRHDASVVLIYKPNARITCSTTWVYGTGNRITLPAGTYPNDIQYNYSQNQYRTFFTEKNAYIMPAYHRWDVGIQFHKQLKQKRERTIEVSVYNLYNRNNPYFYYIIVTGTKDNPNRKLKQVSIFPILPSVAYRIKF